MSERRFDELRSTLLVPEENPLVRWFLLTGRRFSVMVALMVLVFVVLIGLSFVLPVEMRRLLTETSTGITLFSSLLSGAILLVSIVVSINSVVLSQEMTDLEDQEQRITASLDYHRRIEGFIQADITPARPADFLQAVMYAVATQVYDLEVIAQDSDNEAFRAEVEEFADYVARDLRQSRSTLGTAKFGTFKVLLAGLNYNYSGQLQAARSLKNKHEGTLSDEAEAQVDEIIDTIKSMGTGREYFKSLYYKRELAHLSTRLLYVSLPVIVFTSYVMLALDAALFPDVSFFGVSPLLISVTFAYTVALAPYLLLTAYIIRASAVTLRTLAAGPFILQKGDSIGSLDWTDAEQSHDWELLEQMDDE
ncbi:hypothetical protein [Halobacterium zhouii]|uniref:hypothetical protein n=1 Tax=Halobacterium zhouii TaxID=2902624 RepID=UPI001E56DF03|nr:hypothetical protein [Halobacterium zhouii]